MKRALALLLAVLLVLAVLPASAASKTMYVKTDNGLALNVRSSMKTRSDNVVTHLSYGTKVTVLSESGTWAKIKWGSSSSNKGYVLKKYLSSSKPSAKSNYRYIKADNKAPVNVRSSMSTKKDNVLFQLSVGTKVKLLNTFVGGWSKISCNGKTGYVLSKYLSTKK